MNYDKTTFGTAPAALYLVLLLNERNNPILARKVSKVITSTRRLLHDVEACHLYTDEMQTSTFCSLINMIKTKVRESTARIPDEFIGHMACNILIGEIRTLENRCIQASKLQQKVARLTPSGESVPMMKAVPMKNEPTEEERNAILQERSRRYLERKGKKNTLY